MGPITIAATRLDWDQFATLTYAGKGLRETETMAASWARQRLLLQYVRAVHKAFDKPKDSLTWLAREEQGEQFGNWHWHVLWRGLYHVAGRGVIPSPNATSDSFRLKAEWERCRKGAGHSYVRPFDARLSGVSYILKGLENLEWSQAGANAYELGKFNEDSEDRQLIAAPRFWLEVDRDLSRNRRHRKAHELKMVSRDRSTRGISTSVPKPDPLKHAHDTTGARKRKKRSKDWTWKPGKALPNAVTLNPGTTAA